MTVLFLKTLRAIYKLVAGQPHIDKPLCTQDPELASKAIKDILLSEKPAMIARLGSTELTSIANYVSVVSGRRPWLQYIKGTTQPWWWNEENIRQMAIGAGFFPAEIPAIEEFCELMLRDMTQVDLLGSWLPMENQFAEQLRRSQKVDLELLNPYFSTIPWTRALTGKKVLVIDENNAFFPC